MGHEELVQEHTKMLSEANERSKSNENRINKFYELAENIFELTKNTAVIAEQTKQQGEQLTKLVETLENQETRIDGIEHQMETKDTVAELEKRVETIEVKDLKKAEQTLNKLTWLIIASIITTIASVIGTLIFG